MLIGKSATSTHYATYSCDIQISAAAAVTAVYIIQRRSKLMGTTLVSGEIKTGLEGDENVTSSNLKSG